MYARAVDLTILVALGILEAAQSKLIEDTKMLVSQLLGYCAMNPDARFRYNATNITLCIHSDVSYFSEIQARSRAGGHFSLGSHNFNNTSESNGEILALYNIMKNIMPP